MLLSTMASVFSAFLFAQSTHAVLTPHQVVANINIVAGVSEDTEAMLSRLSSNTSPSQVRIIGQTVAGNFKVIIKNLSGDVLAMHDTPPFGDGVTQPIVDALRRFVSIHQALLLVVIGKHGIFAQFFLTAPIAAALRSLEAIIDTFAYAMIDLIPTRTDVVLDGKVALDGSVHKSIMTYGQSCVPNPLYPKHMPTCRAF